MSVSVSVKVLGCRYWVLGYGCLVLGYRYWIVDYLFLSLSILYFIKFFIIFDICQICVSVGDG